MITELETIKSIFLVPDKAIIGTDMEVTTILGSCVSVCLWDPIFKVGAMNHFLLAEQPKNSVDIYKYGDTATEKLIESMYAKRRGFSRFYAKIFGGAAVLSAKDSYSIGKRNIQAAIEVLESYNITIIGKDIGGSKGRKISFNTQTGKVRLKYLNQIPI